jgi:hypothetical protein
MKTDLKPGDKLFFEGSHNYNGAGTLREVTIASIGRKWINFDGREARADKETLWADGGEYSSSGRYWRSEAEWKDHGERCLVWGRFSKIMYNRLYGTPKASTEAIRQAAALLGVELDA